MDEETVQYASAGQNVTLYLAAVDAINLSIGCVLCPTNDPIPLVATFTAQILTFDLASPIIAGTPVSFDGAPFLRTCSYCETLQVELFHHSTNVPATISKLVALLDKGAVAKKNPRLVRHGPDYPLHADPAPGHSMLQKGVHAQVEITLRQPSQSIRSPSIPLETAARNKEMGRVLLRRNGETVAAGIVLVIRPL